MDFTLKGGSWCISQALYGHNMAILVREGLKMNCCDGYNPVHNATEGTIKNYISCLLIGVACQNILSVLYSQSVLRLK